MSQKVDLEALNSALTNLSLDTFSEDQLASLVAEQPEEGEEQERIEGIKQRLFHSLFEVHVISGFLVCPETGRKFPIEEGIPDMLLREDEI